MEMREFLAPGAVLPALRSAGKKQLLQQLSAAAAPLAGIDEKLILDTLVERERMGTTGFGGGVAVPHGRIAGLDRIVGLFARLETPVDFDAIDGRPVDLAFLLLSPAGGSADHLKALARVSRTFRDAALQEKLRGSSSADALYAMLVGVGNDAMGSRAA